MDPAYDSPRPGDRELELTEKELPKTEGVKEAQGDQGGGETAQFQEADQGEPCKEAEGGALEESNGGEGSRGAEESEAEDGRVHDSEAEDDLETDAPAVTNTPTDLDQMFSQDSTLLANNPLFGRVANKNVPLNVWEDFMRMATWRTVEEIVNMYNAAHPNTPIVWKKVSTRLDNCKEMISKRRGISRDMVTSAFNRAKMVNGDIENRKDMLAGSRRAAKRSVKPTKGGKIKAKAILPRSPATDVDGDGVEVEGEAEKDGAAEVPRESVRGGKMRSRTVLEDSGDENQPQEKKTRIS